ncbi:hypothetical protein PMN64_04180 [Bradyrhizobium sp. UFLA01-814]|uniref:hypothetical protein n=1 Tax=Bradyrhizobium sp. UFLA01-814 TaxID=3023480 RepID=UPI00398ABB6D
MRTPAIAAAAETEPSPPDSCCTEAEIALNGVGKRSLEPLMVGLRPRLDRNFDHAGLYQVIRHRSLISRDEPWRCVDHVAAEYVLPLSTWSLKAGVSETETTAS